MSDDLLEVPTEPVVNIDANNFTDTEKQLILQVIKRDEDVRIQEKKRIRQLKDDLRELRDIGVPEGEEEDYGRVCIRCRTELGLIFNSGALCPNCEKKICKSCRVPIEVTGVGHSWLCTICAKIRDIRAESGAWFYDGGNRQGKKRKVYGSFLIKKMFSSRGAKKRDTLIFKDPDWRNIVEQDEAIPEEEEDDSYLLITSGAVGDIVVEEGKNDIPFSGKAVVEVSHQDTQQTQQNFESTNKQLKLVDLAQSKTEQDSCISSEVSSPDPEPDKSRAEEFEKYEESSDHGIHSPGIYYNPKDDSSSLSSDNEEHNGDISQQSIANSHEQPKDHVLKVTEEEEEEDVLEDESKTLSLSGIDQHKSNEVDIIINPDVINIKQNRDETTTEDSNDIKDLLHGLPGPESLFVNKSIDEEVFKKPEICKNYEPPKTSDQHGSLDDQFQFSSMQKVGEQPKRDHVVQNDFDLVHLRRSFVRNKNPKFTKVRTDEHSDKEDSSLSSSSDEEDLDFSLRQVVPERRSSFEEDMLHLQKNNEEHMVVHNTMQVADEVILEKGEMKLKVKKEIPKSSLDIDFSMMQKVNYIPLNNDNDTEDSNDLQTFIESVKVNKKVKFSKMKTEEHDGREDGSSSSADDDNGGDGNDVSLDTKKQNGGKGVPEKTEDEYLDEIINEHKADRVSISSYVSDEDIGDYFEVAGEILIGLKYNHGDSLFEVQIHKAKDLPAADRRKNTSDPYVKVYLIPDVKKGGKRKTKAKRQSLNPDFDEVLEFKCLYEELLARTCSISVWHNDAFDKNIHLGEVNINIEEFINTGFSLEEPSPQWLTLQAKSISKEEVAFVGDLEISLTYRPPGSQVAENKKEQKKLPNPTKGSLHINMIRLIKLINVSAEEMVDMNVYCKVLLLADKKTHARFKTKVVKGSIEPEWNTDFTYENVSWSDLQNSVLQLSIVNRNTALVGATRLGLGKLKEKFHDSFGVEVDVWKDMLNCPNEEKVFSVPLRSTLDSVKSQRSVPPTQVKIITEKEHDDLKKLKKKDFSGSQSSLAKRLLNADTISLASSGSMLSIYSMAGGEHGNIVITGEILFAVKHDENSGIFSVDIEKAKGIAAVNAKQQTSDPYVKTYLLPDKLKTTKKKTTHRRKTLNPQWNECIKYKMSREELLKKTLQVSLWHHDRFGRNDFLGEVQLNLKHYANTNKLEEEESVWYTLQEAAPVSVGGSDDNKGELVLAVKFDHDTITVQIKEAHGLPSVDAVNQPSPFVKCYLLPDKSRRSKRKSSVQKKTTKPIWNDKFEYKAVPVTDLQSRVLELTVWDYNRDGHQFLGGLRLGLPQGDEYWHDCFGKEVQIWEAMIKHLGIFAEFTLPLRATMTSRKSEEPMEIPMITKQLDVRSEITIPTSDSHDVYIGSGHTVIRMGLQYVPPELFEGDEKKKKKAKGGELKVHLKEAKHLPHTADGDLPSTFCKVFMHPKKKSAKFKTDTYVKSVDPAWDSEMSFEGINPEELRKRVLEVMIYDGENEKKPRLIGLVRVGSGGLTDKWDDSVGNEKELWNSMLNNPNQWNFNTVPIRLEEVAMSMGKDEKPEKASPQESKKQKKTSAGEKNDSDEEEEEYERQPNGQDGSESPRTSALRAMGVHATNVIDIMQNRDVAEQETYQAPPESLSPIVEENELEYSGSDKRMSIPQITVSVDVKPGDPPFVASEEKDDDEFNVDFPYKMRKEQPALSLLKRSTSRESLTSIYSTDSANIYGQVPVRGDLQFGMKYDHAVGIFQVHVFQARDIAAVDTKKQISDAYCKAYLLPDKTKGSKKKTKTRKKTLYPEWEDVLEYKISLRDLRTRTLWLALWHRENLGRNIFLGEVMVGMDGVVDNPEKLEAPTPEWYTLCEKGAPPMAELFKGEMVIGLMFEDIRGGDDADDSKSKKNKKKKKKEKHQSRGIINLHIKEGIDLPAADKDGLSDPFCKCYIIPLKSNKTKRKTPVIKDTLNPQWDYRTEYQLDYEDLGDNGIEFTVWDYDRGSQNDFLGCARISSGMRSASWDDAEGVEIEAWKHLINEPNKWKEFRIPLRSKMDPRPPKDY